VGIDRFTDYYSRDAKERNLRRLRDEAAIFPRRRRSRDGRSRPRDRWRGGHLPPGRATGACARAGAKTFSAYLHDNILATQRLLEAVKSVRGTPIRRLVYASSSSVYGNIDDLPMRESSPTKPHSPYGVTQAAGEHLCELYRTKLRGFRPRRSAILQCTGRGSARIWRSIASSWQRAVVSRYRSMVTASRPATSRSWPTRWTRICSR